MDCKVEFSVLMPWAAIVLDVPVRIDRMAISAMLPPFAEIIWISRRLRAMMEEKPRWLVERDLEMPGANNVC
ncbi:hypothetical protein JT06_06055 [Desulfobulbus sp. Tol-SR]|jgi:hypothetical protein|nr:hypothetical protein JT06_06055 [Desulfobulbus sp. Tol-SR]